MDGRDGMRAADSDRQAVAERLRVALDEGRLDLHEYDERLQRAYAARTYAELDALVGDLPGAAAAVPAGVPVPRDGGADAPVPAEGGRGVTARWLAEVWEPWLKVVGIVVVIWVVTSLAAGEPNYFWPGWVAGPWGAVVLVRTVTGLATGEPRRQAAERERRRQRRAEKRALKRERAAIAGQQPGEIGADGVAGDEAAGRDPGEQARRPERGGTA
ncbi:DUF1707 domain-containing protein [Micromonospora sp. WMMD1082]|uniref:DUF1707 SHOCT-like domain-containing protein n=1 Tax=Micromonospora sp. WMMD1082 TaxID=3016104 RepID=UPI002417AEB3|nr:DUF1707 domain-containing protein [Micromonospora sp. WMMD1082]MDG4794006.1 DUF1707 domain-containing protein [Micromonospora sp. WMMD1082]